MKKIMLSVTAVNECSYCEWGHTKGAISLGITQHTIDDIMASNFDQIIDDDTIALEFAQHYARTNNNPSPKEIKKLIKYYGRDRSTDILNFIKMISIGNRLGTAIDAFEIRMMGISSQNSSFCFEFVIYLLAGGPLMRKMMQKANFRPTFTK